MSDRKGVTFDGDYFEERGSLFPKVKALFYGLVTKLFLAPDRLLDVGCARGEFVQVVSFLGVESYGVDVSAVPLEQLPDSIRERCYTADAADLPFPDDFFDVVTSFATLEHIPAENTAPVIKEIARVARERVLLQICVRDSPLEQGGHYKQDPTHVNVRTSRWWKEQFSRWGVEFREVGPRLGVFVLYP